MRISAVSVACSELGHTFHDRGLEANRGKVYYEIAGALLREAQRMEDQGMAYNFQAHAHNRLVVLARAAASVVVLLLAACSSNYSRSNQQVIYIPSDNGVETERANVGVSASTPEVFQSRPSDIDAQQSVLLQSSAALTYVGRARSVIFVESFDLVGTWGWLKEVRGRGYVTPESLCGAWQEHVDEIVHAGDMTLCLDSLLDVEVWRSGAWERPAARYHAFEYEFKYLFRQCNDLEGCLRLPLEQTAIASTPVCAVVLEERFATSQGLELRLIDTVDPSIYGDFGPLGALADAQLSIASYGNDFSNINTRAECAAFARRHGL